MVPAGIALGDGWPDADAEAGGADGVPVEGAGLAAPDAEQAATTSVRDAATRPRVVRAVRRAWCAMGAGRPSRGPGSVLLWGAATPRGP